jgi:hypothetical protein
MRPAAKDSAANGSCNVHHIVDLGLVLTPRATGAGMAGRWPLCVLKDCQILSAQPLCQTAKRISL